MKFHIITLFPEIIESYCSVGVIGQAIKAGQIEIKIINPRRFTSDVHQTVDDRPFGGGDGMIMKPEPLGEALDEAIKDLPVAKRVYLSPQGKVWNDNLAQKWSLSRAEDNFEGLILLCGRYGGIDQRLLQIYSLEEVSIGDYVMSGGELAALVMIDSLSRKCKGVLGNEESAEQDSFVGGLLEAPQYTRPRSYKCQEVPEVFLSGDHAKIKDARQALSVLTTYSKRPDMVRSLEQIKRAKEVAASFFSKEELKSLGLVKE